MEAIEDGVTTQTMATDGVRLFYNPEFVKTLNLNELAFVVAHEGGHVMFMHALRQQGREHERWNYACDHAINLLLDSVIQEEVSQKGKPSIEMPKGGLCDHQYDSLPAETIYAKLPPMPPGGGGQAGKGPGGKGLLDDHGQWGKQVKDDKGNVMTAADIEAKVKETVAQAVTAARMQGKLPASIAQLVSGILQPKLDWKSILRDMVTSCAKNSYKMAPGNRRHIWRGLCLPSTTGETIEIAAAIDTSGSIRDEEVKEFLGEIQGICEAFDDYTVHLFMCDAKIQYRCTLTPGDDIPLKIIGRGGTDFRPVFEEIDKEQLPISSLVYITDLYGSFPAHEPEYATIWVAVSDQKPPFGDRIQLPRDK
jgi:predicted metal-dependent peptidase